MRFLDPSKAHGPIGLSIDARWIRAAQVSLRGSTPTLLAAMHAARPKGADQTLSPTEAKELVLALERLGFRGDAAVITVDPGVAPVATLDLPPRGSGAPLDLIAASEIARTHKLNAGEFELALWDIPREEARGAREPTQAIAAVCEHARAEALVAPFDPTGLSVIALQPSAQALSNAALLAAGNPQGQALHGILHVGWSAAEVVVLRTAPGSGPSVVYERALPDMGLARVEVALRQGRGPSIDLLDAALTIAPDPDDADHPAQESIALVRRAAHDYADVLAEEVSRSLAYAVRRSPASEWSRLLVCGEGARLPDLASRLEDRAGAGTRTLTAREVVSVPDAWSRLGSSSALIPALGASLWATRARRVA